MCSVSGHYSVPLLYTVASHFTVLSNVALSLEMRLCTFFVFLVYLFSFVIFHSLLRILNREWCLIFVKCYFFIYWNNHIIFFLFSVSVVTEINWSLNFESILYFQTKLLGLNVCLYFATSGCIFVANFCFFWDWDITVCLLWHLLSYFAVLCSVVSDSVIPWIVAPLHIRLLCP